ncbi:GTP-binding protein [Flavobacterium psychroterrae]|uniref:GTP-binding protein n=1 Tax=Flavobacterium psychroterrae TaxID=2133767 RepID=A0ABS5PDT4_9FLAO|nr:GTP-binding protein [Flavobacterium psychroterrae]MBS7232442.1 GTP-binding protein [Flavobacterium psychroterrae]
MEQPKKINVYIITGFLGSGKTTVLNNLLKQFSTEKNVVIENEFGKINIDATLINGTFEFVYELTNGCICCSINNQLLETLTRIHTLENQPDNLFIETTGIADAGEIAANFTALYVAEAFDLKKIITVVDAENILFYKDSNIEVTKQIVAAGTVIINKSALVASEIITDIKDFIQAINPYTTIILSNDGSLDRMNLEIENSQKPLTPATIYKSESVHKIKTMLYETDDFFDIQKLKYELFKNLYLYYHQIYRIKGYVLNAENEVFLVQTTGKTVVISPVENQLILKSQLVFIGKELELKTIERLLKSAIVKNKKLQLF